MRNAKRKFKLTKKRLDFWADTRERIENDVKTFLREYFSRSFVLSFLFFWKEIYKLLQQHNEK